MTKIKNARYAIIFILLSVSIVSFSSEKNNKNNFVINGEITADTGKIFLYFFQDYIPTVAKELETEVRNKKFTFSGYIPDSHSVFIIYNNQYRSDNFIIDKGSQTITINTSLSDKVPKISNKTMNEEYPKYSEYFKQINANMDYYYLKYDSIRLVYNNNIPEGIRLILNEEYNSLNNIADETLLNYSKYNPDSKLAFWRLVHIMNWGYIPIIDSIYNCFSVDLRNSYSGSILKEKITKGKVMALGKFFPTINCLDIYDKPLSNNFFCENKYTLIELWYSRCSPCKAQFVKLRDLYKKYNNKGFEIIGISVDLLEDKSLWKKTIIEENLSWPQYLDNTNIVKDSLLINTFPSNFLIDNSGRIIHKNISLEALNKILDSDL